MTSTEPQSLETLLAAIDLEPGEHAGALRGAREARMGDGAVGRHLDRLELEYLRRRAADRRASPELVAAVARAEGAAQDARVATLGAAPDDSSPALFDLVEVRAELLVHARHREAEDVQAEIERRIDCLEAASPTLRYEAGERYAALITAQEKLPIEQEIQLLDQFREVFDRVATKTGDKSIAKLARRLRNASGDRRLQQRLEKVLSRPGVAILEATSLVLLLVLFALLFAEMTFGTRPWLTIADASICLFFIAEFTLKFALAPLRWSWFLRNALTDLLPAIPAALWFVAGLDTVGKGTGAVRALRLIRVVQFARYIQALRPLLGVVRLVLFMVRGMDSLVERFSKLLNRNFVFFEMASMPMVREPDVDERTLLFRAQRREHVLLADMKLADATPLLCERAEALASRQSGAEPIEFEKPASTANADTRDVPVEHACEFLWRLRPEQLSMWLPRADILALDRMARIVNAPIVRLLPVLRWFRIRKRLGSPEERVVELGRRIAERLEAWRDRALRVADMHGIVTGPQILDRVASAIVKFSQRPAIRLLMFGGLFTLVRLVVGADSWLGEKLSKFVATPLVILGAVCLIVLALGKWMKSLAGEAADRFKLTSEAHFIGLLELAKRRSQDTDLEFLGRRVFRWDMDSWEASGQLAQVIRGYRTGEQPCEVVAHPDLDDDLDRVGLLYLHFLDGAPLHASDIQTTEQLLANLSMENIRNDTLTWTRLDQKRLKRISPLDASFFGGSWVWFRFITESIAVETAKRVTDYNRHCLTIEQRAVASPEERKAFAQWLRRRRKIAGSRLERTAAPSGVERYATTEFNALDFLTVDGRRDQQMTRMFGRHVTQILRLDRQRMIREIFGTRRLHELPRARRIVNFYAFWRAKLSRGRVFLVPIYAATMAFTGIRLTIQRTMRIIREILQPGEMAAMVERGRAPFAVAVRKIQRMRGPTAIEALRIRTVFDPAFSGAPPGWSMQEGFEPLEQCELERDMTFLRLRERDREGLRDAAILNRQRVQELHNLVRRLPHLVQPAESDDEGRRRRGERAVTVAYITDKGGLRSLLRAEAWLEAALPEVESPSFDLPARRWFALGAWIGRGFRKHPVRRWADRHLSDRRISRRGRRNLVRLWRSDPDVQRTIRRWLDLPKGSSVEDHGIAIARQVYASREDVTREIAALRAIQSLTILDTRNYRKLVFDLGGYEADGEDRALAEALP